MLPFAGTVRIAGPFRIVNGSSLGRSVRRTALGGWEIDVVRGFKYEDLTKLDDGVIRARQSAVEAFDLLNAFEQELDAVEAQKRQVQALPVDLVQIVAPSIHASDDLLRRMARQMAVIDLIFFELVDAFDSMAQSMEQVGFTAEATRTRNARRTLNNWRLEAQKRLYPKIDAARDDLEAMDRDFLARLRSRGLRRSFDNDKPEYWTALDEAVATAKGLEAASLSGSGDFRLGAISKPLAQLIGIIAIIGGVLIALNMVLSRHDSAKEATKNALVLIDDVKKYDAKIDEQVAKGEKSIAQGQAEKAANLAATVAAAKAAKELADALNPPPTTTVESTLQGIFFWGILPVAGGLILLKVLKII